MIHEHRIYLDGLLNPAMPYAFLLVSVSLAGLGDERVE